MYRVIKVLNNNGVLVYDMKRQEEAILLGNGIGFGKKINERFERDENTKRYTIVDRKEKMRTGRQVLSDMDPAFLELAGRIVELARTEWGELNPNILIPLADHIAVAVERMQNGILLKNPFHGDIRVLYPEEFQIALKARDMVQEISGCALCQDEVGYIALHIRAGRMDEKLEESLQMVTVMRMVVAMVEDSLGLKLDPHSFMFERFMTHLRYLVVRIRDGESIHLDMDEYARKQFPRSYELAQQICVKLEKELHKRVPREAVGHLGIHIERLCVR
ncbi:MAG: PRD domain-containing protein [Lachnospiraceae bacterium]|nr:PRD domain-containing protein [Lachnospiraceae bacterium]MCI9282053.1 PRD domain-containing protein [Lachnospiraceae bacterium]